MRAGYASQSDLGLAPPAQHARSLTLATMGLSIYLYTIVPKGFFPQQDTGRMFGNIQAAQDISFQAMRQKLTEVVDIIKSDPAVDSTTGFSGGGSGNTNSGRMFIALKPASRTAGHVSIRSLRVLRPQARQSAGGADSICRRFKILRIGGRASSAQYQYTLQSVDLAELNTWVPEVERQLRTLPEIVDVNSDQ